MSQSCCQTVMFMCSPFRVKLTKSVSLSVSHLNNGNGKNGVKCLLYRDLMNVQYQCCQKFFEKAVARVPVGGSTLASEAGYVAQSLNGYNFATVCPIDPIQLLTGSS